MSILKNAFVIHDNDFINKESADEYFKILNELTDWKYNTVKGYALNRETIVFADPEIVADKSKIPPIWGDNIVVLEWPKEILELKGKVEQKVKELTGVDWVYNIALGNRYKKAKDYISPHSDREEWGSTKSISSISLGIPRTFNYMNKDLEANEKISLVLNNGSLIFMGDNCQEKYTHGMKKESLTKLADKETLEKYNNTRINITFRVWNY